MTTESNSREELWDFIKDIRFAMFTTRHANGHLHSRPMTMQNKTLDDDSCLWFFMSRRGEPVLDLSAEPNVNLGYANPSADRYVSVSGVARVVEDKAKVNELWSKMAEAWFPGGVDDPDLRLVAVQIIHAHYWDVKESKITQFFEMASAVLTGDPPKVGESGEIRLN